jgi:hypothetical protein
MLTGTLTMGGHQGYVGGGSRDQATDAADDGLSGRGALVDVQANAHRREQWSRDEQTTAERADLGVLRQFVGFVCRHYLRHRSAASQPFGGASQRSQIEILLKLHLIEQQACPGFESPDLRCGEMLPVAGDELRCCQVLAADQLGQPCLGDLRRRAQGSAGAALSVWAYVAEVWCTARGSPFS